MASPEYHVIAIYSYLFIVLSYLASYLCTLSIATAAREHSVPRTSHYKTECQERSPMVPGRKPYLDSDEETQLAKFIIECASVGYEKARVEIITIAENTACDKKKLRKDRITHGWYNRFMKRQPYLSLHKGDAAANVQLDAIMPEAVKHYFNLLDKILQENNLKESPAQIYNVDETGVAFEHRPKNVLTLKGQKKNQVSHFWEQKADDCSCMYKCHRTSYSSICDL